MTVTLLGAAWGGDGYLERAVDLLSWLDASGPA
jgi:hypothetical protein